MTEDTDRMLHESPKYRQETLSAALDGMLTPDEQAALDAHLAGCDACTRELDELRQVHMLLRAMPQPALPRSFLLPVEGEPVAPRAPVRAAEREPATNVTPLRQPARRESRATRTLQVTRWIGTIAAVLGMALFLGTLLPTLSHQAMTASTGAPMYGAQSGTHYPADAGKTATLETNPSPTQSISGSGNQSTDKNATPTASSTVPASSGVPSTPPQADVTLPGPSLADILRVAGLVLLFGGVALALIAFIAARLV